MQSKSFDRNFNEIISHYLIFIYNIWWTKSFKVKKSDISAAETWLKIHYWSTMMLQKIQKFPLKYCAFCVKTQQQHWKLKKNVISEYSQSQSQKKNEVELWVWDGLQPWYFQNCKTLTHVDPHSNDSQQQSKNETSLWFWEANH